jgi:hypothetical protein
MEATEEVTGPTGPTEESTGPTGPTEQASAPTGPTEESTGPTEQASAPTGPTEQATGPTEESTGPTGPTEQATGPASIRLDDILSSMQFIQHKEAEDRVNLESVGALPYEYLKSALIQWATSGFRNAYPIYELRIDVPSLCSDGQTRSLQEYIQFVSGKTIYEHVATLQARFPDIVVSFSYTGVSIVIVVSKA